MSVELTAEEPEHEHIEEQVHKVGVPEGVGQEGPDFAAGHGGQGDQELLIDEDAQRFDHDGGEPEGEEESGQEFDISGKWGPLDLVLDHRFLGCCAAVVLGESWRVRF